MVSTTTDASFNQGSNDPTAFDPVATPESIGGDTSVSDLFKLFTYRTSFHPPQTNGSFGDANGDGTESVEELVEDGSVTALSHPHSAPRVTDRFILGQRAP